MLRLQVSVPPSRPLWARTLRLIGSTICHSPEPNALPPPPKPCGQRPPRFYVSESLKSRPIGSMFRLSTEESQHAVRTLRLREGSAIELCDGRGYTANASITTPDKSSAVVHLVTSSQLVVKDRWQWTLVVACGSLKGGRSDWLIEKSAELGAAAFQPLLTTRSQSIGSDDGGRQGRWRRVATAAIKQCLRPYDMDVLPPCSVEDVTQRIAEADMALVATEGAMPIAEVLVGKSLHIQPGGEQKFLCSGFLVVGPEGDFTAEELCQLINAGAVNVGLGSLRLRTETAAIALLSYARLVSENSPP